MRWLVRKNGLPFASFLFCPDKTHKTAVERNRSKRILRELVRKHLPAFPIGYDYALLAQVGFAKLSKEDREVFFLSVLKQFPWIGCFWFLFTSTKNCCPPYCLRLAGLPQVVPSTPNKPLKPTHGTKRLFLVWFESLNATPITKVGMTLYRNPLTRVNLCKMIPLTDKVVYSSRYS